MSAIAAHRERSVPLLPYLQVDTMSKPTWPTSCQLTELATHSYYRLYLTSFLSDHIPACTHSASVMVHVGDNKRR